MSLNLGPLNVLLRLQGAEKFNRQTKQATDGLGKLGKKIGALVTIGAVVKEFVRATQVFAEFERGMVRVGAVTNSLGSTAFESLTERARDLASTTEFTARQVADAMGFMGMAGMKTNQIYDATPAVLQLASAGMVDVATAADTVTNIMSGYGIETKDLDKANNVLVATFTNSNTSLQQLGQSFKYVGPVANAAGVAFKDTAAVIGLMGNAGIQADMAGTSLRGSLIRLIKPTAEASEVIRQYGLKVKDSNGKLKPMVEIFRQLEPIAGDSAAIVKLFGLEAGPGMQAALKQGTGALEQLISKIDNAGNIAERVANAQMNTLDGKIKTMTSNVESLQIALGEALEPTSTAFVEALSQAAQFAKYIVDVLSFAEETTAETSEIEKKISVLATQRAKATAQLQGLRKAIAGGFEDVYIQQKLTGFANLSPEAALGGLEMQIGELTDMIAHLGKKGFKIELPKMGAPIPIGGGGGGKKFLSEQERKKQFERAGMAYRHQIAETPFESAAPGFVDVLAKIGYQGAIAVQNSVSAMFTPTMIGSVISPLAVSADALAKKQAEAAEAAAALGHRAKLVDSAFENMVVELVGTISKASASFMGGTMGATFGPQIASAFGGAIGAMLGSPQIGSAIGGAVGEIFGPLFDVVAKSVEVFKPIIDIFNQLAVGLVLPMLVAMAPGMESFARALEKIVPLVEMIGVGLGFLDFAFSNLRIAAENLVTAIGNVLTGNIEGAFTTGMQDFFSAEEYLARVEEERAKILSELNGETNTTAARFRELNEELTNVPTGIKRLRAFQFGAMQGSGRGTPFGQSAFGV